MKHLFLALACLMPSICLGQNAFVDPQNNVKIKTNLDTFEYGATRTIYFDNNDNSTIEANLPEGVGYIYIYDAYTRKGVIEFSRTPRYIPAYPYYGGDSCNGHSSHNYYRGR